MRYSALIILLFLLVGSTGKIKHFDLSDYHHPDGDEVELFTKVPIVDRESTIELGDLLFHKPTSISRVSCAQCHDLRFSGRSVFNKEAGGGLFREKYKDSFVKHNKFDPFTPIDRKPFKNITVLNSHRIHDSGVILHHGAEAEFPLEAQIDSATNAHFMEDLVLECRHDGHLQKLSMKAFEKPLDASTIKSAISAFEQTLTTSETNASRGVITKSKGFQLFDKLCKDCHFNRVKSQSLAHDPMHAEVIPQSLENVLQSAGYFQTSEDITLYKAIKRHRGIHVKKEDLPARNIRKIVSFLRADLTDKRYTR